MIMICYKIFFINIILISETLCNALFLIKTFHKLIYIHLQLRKCLIYIKYCVKQNSVRFIPILETTKPIFFFKLSNDQIFFCLS